MEGGDLLTFWFWTIGLCFLGKIDWLINEHQFLFDHSL